MFISNGKTKVVKLWGGYTPKLYDEHFVEDHRDEIDEKFAGATFIGDSHFAYGARYLEKVRFVTPQGDKRDPEIEEVVEGDEALAAAVYEFDGDSEDNIPTRKTKENAVYTAAVHKVRARVETVFGFLKTKFCFLRTPFQESSRQHDNLVWYATGVYNSLQHVK